MLYELGETVINKSYEITADLSGVGWAIAFLGAFVGVGAGVGIAWYLTSKGEAKKLDQIAKIAEYKTRTLEALKDKVNDPTKLVEMVNDIHPYGTD